MPTSYSHIYRVFSPLPSAATSSAFAFSLGPFNIGPELQTPPRQSFHAIHSPSQYRLFDTTHAPASPRKAPRPPQYKHRRRRSRHIRFKDPSHSGLFTLTEGKEEEEEEEEEMAEGVSLALSSAPISRIPSAAPSSEIMLDEDVKSDGLEPSTLIKEWTVDLPSSPPTTAIIDQLSPSFALDEKLETPTQPSQPTAVAVKAPRRPPPLNLSQPPRKRRPTSWYRHHPFAAPRLLFNEAQLSDESQPLPDSSLLSPLPVLSPGVFRARQRSASTPSPKSGAFDQSASCSSENLRLLPSALPAVNPCDSPDSEGSDIDLECVLQELLASCGEVSPRYLADYSSGWSVDRKPSPDPSVRSSSVESGSDGHSSDLDLGYDLTSFPLRLARKLLSPIQLSPQLRTPTTPPRLLNPFVITTAAASATPATPMRMNETSNWTPKLRGNHSFLQTLSRGEDTSPVSYASTFPTNMPLSPSNSFRSSASSSASAGSGKLPKRMGLPDMWKV